MTKYVIIAGCRNYTDYDGAKLFIDSCLSELRKDHDIIIMSGCSSGADLLGERYAKLNNLKIKHYPPNWRRFGRGAGPIRNRQMAEDCDLLICFWDKKSKGTKSMIECAKKLGKQVEIKWI